MVSAGVRDYRTIGSVIFYKQKAGDNNMFKLIYTQLAGPQGDINVSAGLVGEAGMVGIISPNSLTGDPEVVLYASGAAATNGLVGIIDDQKTSSFSATVISEVVASGATALAHANVIAAADTSVLTSVPASYAILTSRTNGTINAASGACTVSYSYVIPGKAGDDTTLASGKCTIWLAEGEYSTDVIELGTGTVLSSYVVGAPLYVADNAYGQQGRLTTRNVDGKVWAYVTKAPTAGNPVINFFKKGL